MGRLREYHYEVSQPRRNPSDNHYYQRVRQVDAEGRLTAFGERIFKSTVRVLIKGFSRPKLTCLRLDLRCWMLGSSV